MVSNDSILKQDEGPHSDLTDSDGAPKNTPFEGKVADRALTLWIGDEKITLEDDIQSSKKEEMVRTFQDGGGRVYRIVVRDGDGFKELFVPLGQIKRMELANAPAERVGRNKK